ncbi:MAG: hypothetical protein EHM36_00535 [Deltaproteobacteria bacterium]|nr:MAG: hypothetical protein EHM36_00535 [Deltaproteobacteria bacterium]
MHRNGVTRIEGVCLLLVFLGLVWGGCSTLKERPRDPAKGRDVGVGNYYFEDVLIPKELSYEPSESFVYEAAQLKTGSMVFKKWRIDLVSLVDFFLDHMEKDNWKLVNSFQGKETILNFTKPDKTCTIKITEKWYGTAVVEVRVGPVETKKM